MWWRFSEYASTNIYWNLGGAKPVRYFCYSVRMSKVIQSIYCTAIQPSSSPSSLATAHLVSTSSALPAILVSSIGAVLPSPLSSFSGRLPSVLEPSIDFFCSSQCCILSPLPLCPVIMQFLPCPPKVVFPMIFKSPLIPPPPTTTYPCRCSSIGWGRGVPRNLPTYAAPCPPVSMLPYIESFILHVKTMMRRSM